MNVTRYQNPNNSRIQILKIPIDFLLSSFDSNDMCDIVVPLHILSFIHVLSVYKIKCNYNGQKLTTMV